MNTDPRPMPSEVLPERLVQLGRESAGAKAQFKQLIEEWRPVIVEAVQALIALPETTRNALVILGEHGWYVNPALPAGYLLTAAADLLEDPAKATRRRCEVTDARAAATESSLSAAFPRRARLLAQAFSAHRSQQYALSVPVLLAQADGICQELQGVQLYARARGTREPALKRRLGAGDLDPFVGVLLEPLVTDLPITASAAKRASSPVSFNRQAILHGESVDYDTFENSCRAIAYITYVVSALELLKPAGSAERWRLTPRSTRDPPRPRRPDAPGALA